MRLMTLGIALLAALLTPLAAAAPAAAAFTVDLTVPGVRYVSQTSEPSPAGWHTATTPYCAVASSLSVMDAFGFQEPANPLRTLFSIAYRGNSLGGEAGLDPAGVSYLMRYFGGEGRVHMYTSRAVAITELVGRLNAGVPVMIFAEAGYHAETVYGYQAVAGGGPLTGIYVQDPLTGFRGLVSLAAFTSQYHFWGSPFQSAGSLWRNNYVFVSYREYPGGKTPSGPVTYHSAWVTQSAYPTVRLGDTATVSVTLRNTGTITWSKGSATEAHIGVLNDNTYFADAGFAAGWLSPNRPAAQTEDSVAPGETATFSFTVRGAAPGAYPLRLRPVIDGVTWMEDQGIYLLIMSQ